MIVRSRFGIWVCILALVVVVADPATAEPWAFDFGAPGSVTRDGFVKVTSSDGLSGEVGHGFESTEGLLDVDRSSAYWWKKQVHPTNERLGRVYGEYRSTSYTTCDFVEGTQDNAFIVSAPDGEYEVWAIVADPAEAPPFLEIRANGETKHHVRLGRRGFVFMEPFQARAEDGVLRIELAGSHGYSRRPLAKWNGTSSLTTRSTSRAGSAWISPCRARRPT